MKAREWLAAGVLAILILSTGRAAPSPAAAPDGGSEPADVSAVVPATFDSLESVVAAIPPDLMPPGSATSDRLLALQEWAKKSLAEKPARLEFIVEGVSAPPNGPVVVRGRGRVPVHACGRSVRVQVRADFAEGADEAAGFAPETTVTVVGELASSDPLYPTRGKTAAFGAGAEVIGWSDKQAFLGVHVIGARSVACGSPAAAPPAPKAPPAGDPVPSVTPLPVAPPPLPPPPQAKVPATEFFGVGSGAASRIVYILDHSGSMTDSIDYLKFEAKRSIGQLPDDASFHVLFFSSGPPVAMPGGQLVSATEENKAAAYRFIDGIPARGMTDPSEALKMAFALHPDLIYLLTDGEFDFEIVGLVKELNRGHEIHINTLGFLYDMFGKPLEQIAADSGGTYKFVGEKDLEALGEEPSKNP